MNGTEGGRGNKQEANFIYNIKSTTEFYPFNPQPVPKGSVSVRSRKTSQYLPKGAQGQLIDGAILAAVAGCPINTLTTIRTEILSQGSSGIFAGRHEADGVTNLLTLMRKWNNNHGIPWVCIWSREVGAIVGGHFHFGTYQSNESQEPYIKQMELWLDEKRIFPKHHNPTNIGISEHGSWLVQRCSRLGHSGPDLAAYIGKDEQSYTTSAWRVKRDNKAKRVLNHTCRGGYIEGTIRTAYRHGTSRNIAPATYTNSNALKLLSSEDRLMRPDMSYLPY